MTTSLVDPYSVFNKQITCRKSILFVINSYRFLFIQVSILRESASQALSYPAVSEKVSHSKGRTKEALFSVQYSGTWYSFCILTAHIITKCVVPLSSISNNTANYYRERYSGH
jgi:hypothetical protein